MKTRIKINGFIIVCAIVLMAIFPDVFLRQRRAGFNIGFFCAAAGFSLMFLGQLLRVSARGYKSEHSQNSGALVTGGPYALVRNPMYLGILLVGLGVNLVLFQWWVAALFLLVFMARYIPLLLKEEKKLLAAFGQEYKEYMQRAPRLFPSLKMLANDANRYLPLKRSWFNKEKASIIATIAVVLLIGLWQSTR